MISRNKWPNHSPSKVFARSKLPEWITEQMLTLFQRATSPIFGSFFLYSGYATPAGFECHSFHSLWFKRIRNIKTKLIEILKLRAFRFVSLLFFAFFPMKWRSIHSYKRQEMVNFMIELIVTDWKLFGI